MGILAKPAESQDRPAVVHLTQVVVTEYIYLFTKRTSVYRPVILKTDTCADSDMSMPPCNTPKPVFHVIATRYFEI